MKTMLRLLLICYCVSFAIAIPALAGAPAPSQRLEAEKKAFMESQISDEHKLFLDTLGERLGNLIELNRAASGLFEAISAYETKPSDADSILKKHSRKALSLFLGPEEPVANLKQFSLSFFSRNDISSLLDEITDLYERCLNISQSIDAYSQRGGASSGSFYYFGIRSDSFEKAFDEGITEVLENASRKYIQLYPVTKEHDIKRLQAESDVLSEYFKQAESLLQTEVIEPLEVSHQTWMNAMFITVTKLVQKNYQLNYAFAESMKQVLAGIRIPRQPELADLTVPSIEIILPKKVKRGSRVKIIVQIKNIGELTSDASQASVLLADGRKRIIKIPRLAPDETKTINLQHTIRGYTENTFVVTANYNQKAPERDYENNSTRRSLILPAE